MGAVLCCSGPVLSTVRVRVDDATWRAENGEYVTGFTDPAPPLTAHRAAFSACHAGVIRGVVP